MFLNTLRNCDNEILQLGCCGDRLPCNCENALTADYYTRNDSYNCRKKMDTYVIKYGPSYISEIYHYLEASQILTGFQNSSLNVISLGCGFAPDYYALYKYNQDNQLNIQINYTGLDLSTAWNTGRPPIGANCQFQIADLTRPFNLQGAHIVFICKSFSTMYRNGHSGSFLNQLRYAINSSLAIGSIMVFVDVNLDSFGRDEFHHTISPIFGSNNQYFFSGSTYIEDNWTEIHSTDIIYNIEQGFSIDSIDHTNRTIVFEYRK